MDLQRATDINGLKKGKILNGATTTGNLQQGEYRAFCTQEMEWRHNNIKLSWDDKTIIWRSIMENYNVVNVLEHHNREYAAISFYKHINDWD